MFRNKLMISTREQDEFIFFLVPDETASQSSETQALVGLLSC